MAHKAEARDFHCSLSVAVLASSFYIFPFVVISSSIVVLQVSRGRPLFRLPLFGLHINVVRVKLSRSFLITYPSHLHFRCFIIVVMPSLKCQSSPALSLPRPGKAEGGRRLTFQARWCPAVLFFDSVPCLWSSRASISHISFSGMRCGNMTVFSCLFV